MIPYSTCMRFNTRKRSFHQGSSDDKYSPSEWTLVQHFDSNVGTGPAYISVTSQDDQTLCFTWSLGPQLPLEEHRHSLSSSSTSSNERRESEELDDKNVYLFLTLRRRKSLQQSIHSGAISLLDLCYYGITNRYLKQSYHWSFNTFSLDILTGGHSLPSLLLYLFKEYRFIETFQLDLMNVLRCFAFLENGYHDTNPYHNSVHAADVTQAMHCFLQEHKIGSHLTPLEAMCSLLAAVSHDLDHPGVNQNFLVATKSHLASLYNNFSVLESHHYRFALSCFHESKIFDHLNKQQWQEIEYLLRHLILATDISRQGEFIQQFQEYLQKGADFNLRNSEQRHFVLQIALKCADLGNPCRPWNISQKWSVQICNEFYRQGDFERQLQLPVTSICDRRTMTIPSIQTEFFKNIVRPLFVLWDKYLDSSLSRQLINNLNFNDYMWNTMKESLKDSTKSSSQECTTAAIKRRNSFSSSTPMKTDKSLLLVGSSDKSSDDTSSIKRSKSLLNVSSISLPTEPLATYFAKMEEKRQRKMTATTTKCVNGCGTLPNSQEDKLNKTSEQYSSKLEECDYDEEDDFITDRFNDDCGAILSTPALLLPNYYLEKSYYSFSRRGSAPGCIGIRKNDLNTNKTAALFLLRNSIKTNNSSSKRRSSFPVMKKSNNIMPIVNANAALQANMAMVGCKFSSKMRDRRLLEQNAAKSIKACKTVFGGSCKFPPQSSYRGGLLPPPTTCENFYRGRQSLFDVSHLNYPPYAQVLVTNIGNQRRRSVPQDIFIRSLNNYTA